MIKYPIRFTSVLLLAALLLSSCNKNNIDQLELANHNSEFAFPLFNTEIKISDLVNNIVDGNDIKESLTINPDQTILLSYSGDVSETNTSKITDFIKNIPIFPIDSSYFPLPLNIPNGVNIIKSDLKSGSIGVIIKNTLTEKLQGNFVIKQLTYNGTYFSIPLVIEPGMIAGGSLDVSGWRLEGQQGTNNLVMEYDLYLPDGTKVLKLPKDGTLSSAFFNTQNFIFSYVEGYWDRVQYDLNTDTIDIDINQIDINGNVKVKNPKVTITVYNSWGFPTRGLINYLRFKAKNGDLLELESPIIVAGTDVGIDFNYPSFAAGEVGQTKTTTFYFDSSNSNIEEIFNSQPTQMIYKVTGLANAEAAPGLVGFITDSSTVRMNVKVDLLLEGQLKDFPADQTIDLDFGTLADSTGFESAEFKLVTENSMPLTTSIQVYFRDEMGNNVDSLFVGGPQEAIKAAQVDVNSGLTTGTTRTETLIPFTAERFEHLRLYAKKAYLEAAFSTALDGTVPVKLLNTQGTVVKMGIKLKR